MSMSVLERRLQILIDNERYALLENEASSRGASVATVVREAIDAHFATDAGRRATAAQSLLGSSPTSEEPEPDWAQSKAELLADADPVR